MLKGFKEFLFRGNVIDLAVAVVLGTAFVAIVTAVVHGIVTPLLSLFGGTGDKGWGFYLDSTKPTSFVALGPIVSAVINFVLIAAILYFVLVLPATRVMKRLGKQPTKSEAELLTEIRDLLAENTASSGGRHEF